MRTFVILSVALLSSLFAAARAHAALEVSLLTFGPGSEVYERFGHDAIHIRDEARGIDEAFDWGNFRFSNDFALIFLRGDLNYWMEGGKSGRRMLEVYSDEQDRTVIEQTLNLSPAQTRALAQALLDNDTDAKRFYRYDYYRDNCATRARDALDFATSGQLRAALGEPTDQTFRWQTRRMMPVGTLNKLCEILMDLAGGPRIDVPLSRWDISFVPTVLATQLDTVQIQSTDGTTMIPLVRERRVLHTTTSPANAEPNGPWDPTRWTLPFSLISSAALLVLAWARWTIPFRLLATAWELFVLFGTTFIAGMALFTWHWAVAWNENLLQFTPLCLPAIATLWIGRWRRRLRWALSASVALSAVGALVTISHLSPQRAAPAVALALPLHVAVMIGQAWTIRNRRAIEAETTATSPQPALERTPVT